MNRKKRIWRVILAAVAVFNTPEGLETESVPPSGFGSLLGKVHERFHHRRMDYFYCLDLWFSLPLTAWLKSSWIGLALYW